MMECHHARRFESDRRHSARVRVVVGDNRDIDSPVRTVQRPAQAPGADTRTNDDDTNSASDRGGYREVERHHR
jgi:hypothetical protein